MSDLLGVIGCAGGAGCCRCCLAWRLLVRATSAARRRRDAAAEREQDAPLTGEGRSHADQLRRLPAGHASWLTSRSTTSATSGCASPIVSSGSRCATPPTPSSTPMQREFGLHELAVEDARQGHQRPKIEEYGDDACSWSMHAGRARTTARLQIGEVDIFVGTNFVLSVRNRSQQQLPRRARALPSSEPQLLAHGAGLRALCADGRGGRPLLPDASTRWRPSSRSIEIADLRARRGALEHRAACTR